MEKNIYLFELKRISASSVSEFSFLVEQIDYITQVQTVLLIEVWWSDLLFNTIVFGNIGLGMCKAEHY